MRKALHAIAFFVIFLSVYYLINYYVIYMLTYFFGLQENWVFYVTTVFASLAYIITVIIEKNFPSTPTRMLHAISAT